jgi:hypothetical protein
LCPNCGSPSLLVSPPVLTLAAGQAHQFAANASVSWTNTATAGGLYVAPSAVSGEQSVTVTATAVSEPKLSSSALVRLSDAGSLSIHPPHVTVKAGGVVDLVAVGAPANTVEWLTPSLGEIKDGKYKAPEECPGGTVTILARASAPAAAVMPNRTSGCDCPSPCQAPWRLIAMAALLGALGGLVHGLGSFGTFVGNREIKSSWLWWYFLKPFLAAVVAVLVFLVFRAGFGTPDLGLSTWDCLRVAGFAGLVGLFAEPATLKLRDVFESVFTPRSDPRTDKAAHGAASSTTRPVVTEVKVERTENQTVVRILGRGFAAGCAVVISATAAKVLSSAPAELKVEPGKPLESGASYEVVVYNAPPAGDASETRGFKA